MDQVTEIANAGDIAPQVILEAFDRWLTLRMAEARAQGLDLAFHDRAFDISPTRDPPLVGWSHLMLAPGGHPPPGQDWTVYRLQADGLTQSAGIGVADLGALRDALVALGYGSDLVEPPRLVAIAG